MTWRAKDDGLPTVRLTVGNETFDAHIDSGSPSSLTLPEKSRGKFNYLEEPVVIGRGRSVNTEFKVWGGKLKGEAKLGNHVFINPNLHFFSMLDSTGFANIGSAFLRDYVVTIGHMNGLIRFKKGS